jgi:hypothetical protein
MSRQELVAGPRGGLYYVLNGKKVYVKNPGRETHPSAGLGLDLG